MERAKSHKATNRISWQQLSSLYYGTRTAVPTLTPIPAGFGEVSRVHGRRTPQAASAASYV